MTIKILSPQDSMLLRGTPLEKIDLTEAVVAAAIDERGETAATLALVTLPHFEGLWIRPERRGGLMLARLERKLLSKVLEYGFGRVFAFASNPEMEDYIRRLGYKKQPWSVWEKERGE